MTSAAGKQVSINGIDLYYEEYNHDNTKQIIVLLHGFLSSTFSYRRLIPLIQQDFHVVSIDLPPFGRSGKSPAFVYSYQNIARTIIEFMEKMNYEKVSLIGHSMGGQIALNIMKERPELIEKGVLLCSSGYLKKSKWPLVFSSYFPFFHHYVKYWLAKSGVRRNIENVVHNRSLIDEEMMYGYLRPFLEDDIFIALTRMIRHREGDLTKNLLNKIHTPILLIWGEHDKVVPLAVGERLYHDLPNSKLIVLKETGHLVPEEKPEEVKNHLFDFIHNGALV
ncbi:alpha/beta fold hydrolase [Falsibacillus albus]|uniref:Alpha/beta hydrolase n=1 Tax=Falsibacillus albus TaxID=2478915 RepID=A0A3L7K0A3_9BACI|nr:alpha/beta hydrolase [Falsibacillus albus]RLQ96488.1 alpha/beta hydrolase [Falsibacillus albus]